MNDDRESSAKDDAPEPEDEGALRRVLTRTSMLMFWCLVVWGTLYAAVFGFSVLTEGPSRALARAITQSNKVLDVVNLSLAVVAILVWVTVGLTVVRVRSARDGVADAPSEDSP